MRPAGREQDYLQTPLNELLGTPAQVRLVRVLAELVSTPLGAPEAAELTGLTEAGARRALKRLVKTGFVARIGGGRSQQFQLREGEPLVQHLVQLFRSERDRYEALVADVRKIVASFPEITAAWIDDPPSEGGQPLHVGVLGPSDVLSYLERALRSRIVEVERRFDLTIEIHSFSRADVPDVDWESVTLLGGHVAESASHDSGGHGHDDRIERALRASQAISRMIIEDPSLIRRAERHVDSLLATDQGSAVHDLREWKDILGYYSRERLKEFLVSDSPRAQRLRQSSPFHAVLTSEEREYLWKVVDDCDS